MARSREMTLSLPPFTRAVTWLLAINTAVFLLLELFGMTLIDVARWVRDNLALVPQDVVHGSLWQLVTYSFLHFEFWHWFGNMLGIWMFGSAFEGAWGTRRFLELYSFGVIGAALTTTVLSFSHVLGNPTIPTVGASGGVFAILIAFGIVFGENEILMIPFPISLKAKYFVAILIVVTLAFAIQGGGNVAYVAHLGGLFFGYIYVKFVPRGGTPPHGSVRALFRSAQPVLPLEAPPRRPQVRGLHAQTQPHGGIRRTRQLHPPGRRKEKRRLKIGLGKLARTT